MPSCVLSAIVSIQDVLLNVVEAESTAEEFFIRFAGAFEGWFPFSTFPGGWGNLLFVDKESII